ncbi:MAG: glutamate-1-semialdehyde 2,1-aminomutase [Blastocatellia bacterium]
MVTSEGLFERAQRVAPGGVHSPVRAFRSVGGTPVFFESAQGAVLRSVDGRDYIDYCQSCGPLLLGHRDPEVAREVAAAVNSAWSFGACEPYSLELAEFITSRISWVEKLRFVSSGTEAVMSALRVARAATGRHRILKFEGCYHGHADALLVRAGSGLAGVAAATSAGVTAGVAAETLVTPLDDEAALQKVFADYGSEIAALILEPLPANYGLLIQRREFIAAAVRLARENGALVIFDEVITGFRVALGGMAEILGIRPDLVTYGKVIGGGFPVGCYGGRGDLMDQVAPVGPVYQAGTLSANPVGMRAGLATLRKIEAVNAWQTLKIRTADLCRRVESGLKRDGLPFRMTRCGSLFWLHGWNGVPIRSVATIPAGQPGDYARIFHHLLARGIYFAPSGYEVGFLSLAHTDEQIELTVNGILEAVRATAG